MTLFFTLFVLSRASDNTTSQNIGGTDAWAVPSPKKIFGDRPSVPLRSPLLATTTGMCPKLQVASFIRGALDHI